MNAQKSARMAVSAVALIALSLPLTGTAAAPSDINEVKVTVSYDDLNLSSENGAKRLYSRLKKASRVACDYRSARGIMSVREIAEARQCYSNSLDAAVKSIDNSKLARLHQS